MILKKLAIRFIKLYKYFSPLFGNKCRYYPTCSTYAIWEFENDNFFKALFKVTVRILKCNQLFKGGIDYPVVTKKIEPVYKQKKVSYWYVPIKKNKFIVIKADDGKR